MMMGVDQPRRHNAPRGLDHVTGRRQSVTASHDRSTANQNIAACNFLPCCIHRHDNGGTPNQDFFRHKMPPDSVGD